MKLMPETWYRAVSWSREIEPVTVEKFTDGYIWTSSGRGKLQRRARKAQSIWYFPTWAEARQHLLDRAKREQHYHEQAASDMAEKVKEISAMAPPDEQQ
jgi:hypothetical protein